MSDKQLKLETTTIKEFVAAHGFTQVSPMVRENINKYPYLTFINKDNVAENVYFSKNAAKAVAAGTPVTKSLIASLRVANTVNEAGEKRVKLVGAGERLELSDLLG